MSDFDNVTYYKKRSIQRIKSLLGQMDMNFKDVTENLKHIKAFSNDLQSQMDKIYNDFGELLSRIQKSEVKEGEK